MIAVALLTMLEGVEAEAWTGFECGYARARGKYIYGVTSQQASDKGLSQRCFEDMCDELIEFSPGDDITKTHAEISHILASHVMVKNQ